MSSTVYTIGTALGRAKDHGVTVRVLVAGHWIEGMVSAVDGHGVVLTGSGNAHHVIRVEAVSAVLVNSGDDEDAFGGEQQARPAPAPAASQVRDVRLPVAVGYDS